MTPDPEMISELVSELSDIANDSTGVLDRVEDAARVRYCQWEGQSDDGRKHAEVLGEVPFPWEGCSDERVRMADEIINDDVRLLKTSWSRARLKAVGIESSDVKRAAKITTLLKWVFKARIGQNAAREIELAAQWRQAYGLAVMGVFWDQETRIEDVRLTMEEIEAMAAQVPEMQELVQVLRDPLLEEQAINGVVQSLGVEQKAAKKIVVDLREKGVATHARAYVYRSEPKLEALKPFFDVFFPTNTTTLQEASAIYRRVLLTEEQLRDKVLTENWDEEYVEEVIEKHGGFSGISLSTTGFRPSTERTIYEHGFFYEEDKDLYELFYAYHKKTDEENGAIRVCCTVVHPGITDRAAKHQYMPYTHGQLPFVEMPRERPERCLIESRGIPDLVRTWQSAKKLSRDYHADRASISILPPVRVPANRTTHNMTFGPAVQVPERRPGEISWMEVPQFDQGMAAVEERIDQDIEKYFRTPLYNQDLVDSWLKDVALVGQQVLSLVQQYMDPAEVMRVVGGQEAPFDQGREAIQGRYDLQLLWDARDIDHEFLEQKINLIAQMVVPLDAGGVLNRNGLLRTVMSAIDPNMAEELIRPEEDVTQKEIEEEKMEWVKMESGLESTMLPPNSGQNPQLRLQTLQTILETNPGAQEKLQTDQNFAAAVENRVKHLQFLVDQSANAQIGKIGVNPNAV